MAVETLTATRRAANADATPGHGLAGTVKALVGTVEMTAAASATSTYSFGKIPTNARILGLSELHNDDLATTGSPTLDIGLFAVEGNITDNDDALNDGLDAATAGTKDVIKDKANYGKYAYELAGETTDPGGLLEVKVTLKDAACDSGGTISLELLYVVD